MNINYFLAILCLTVLVACKKDFLQRDTGVNQTREDVFADGNLAGRFADRSYTFMINDYGRLGAGGQPFRSCIAEFTDEAVSGSQEPAIKAMNTGNWLDPRNATEVTNVTNTSRGLPPWVRCFQGIRNTNVILERVDTVPWETDPVRNGKLVKAEQLYLRAYFYYELAKRWGGMPLYAKAFELDAEGLNPEIDIPRNTFEETITFIEKDLNAAEEIFATETFSSRSGSGEIYSPARGWNPNYTVDITSGTVAGDVSANNGRADLGMIRALRSRVLLLAASPLWNSKDANNPTGDVNKWVKAAKAAKDVMDMGRYTLHPEYRRLLEVPSSPEYISYIIRGPRVGNADNFFRQYVMSPGSNGTRGILNPTQNHVDLYEMTNGRRITDAGSGYSVANPYLNRDPRLAHNILYNTHPWQSRTISTWYTPNPSGATVYGIDADADNTKATSTGYYCRKMWNENLTGGGTATGLLNYVVMRYGEILLNYAEASNEAGDMTAAVAVLNQIRTGRTDVKMPAVAVSMTARGLALNQANLRDFIRNERAVELAFEDIRWWDILRWKKGKELVAQPIYRMDVKRVGTTGTNFMYTPTLMASSYQRKFEDYYHLYPIPRGEIVKSMSKLIQNPGWPTN